MSKCLFFCVPAVGHLNPQIALANALVKGGEHVIFYATPLHEERIKRSGAEVVVVDTKLDRIVEERVNELGYNVSSIAKITLESTIEIMDETLAEVEKQKPDYIVHDLMTLNGRIAARLNKIPAVCTVPTMAMQERKVPKAPFFAFWSEVLKMTAHSADLLKVFGYIDYLSKKYKIHRREIQWILNDYGDLDIITTSRYFQPYSELFKDEKYKFVGPMLFPGRQDSDFPVERLKGEKVIYISLGSVYNEKPGFFRSCIEAFGNTKYTVVAAMRQSQISNLKSQIPDNFIVQKFVPQLEVLKHAGVFITHGGMNSIQEGLYNNVPLIVVPQAVDQFFNGIRAKELGTAIYMPKPNTRKLKKAVEKVFSDPKYRENAEKAGKTLREAGGVEAAVKHIEEFKRQRGLS